MADAKISAMTAAGSVGDSDLLPVVQGGANRVITPDQLNAYIAGRSRAVNFSTAAQGAFTADTLITSSRIILPTGRIQAGTLYRCTISMTKTAAGTTAPTLNIRTGTLGTTSDTSRLVVSGPTQTAVVDTAVLVVEAYFRAVGASTVIFGSVRATSNLASTGFFSTGTWAQVGASSAFDSTPANTGIEVSINPNGASWTAQGVYAELSNLA